jgi:hypothetical protein
MATKANQGIRVAFRAHGEDVAKLEKRMLADLPAVSDQELIDDVLHFANATGAEFAGLIANAVEVATRLDAALSAASGVAQSPNSDYTREVAPAIQTWLRKELTKLIDGVPARVETIGPIVIFEHLDGGRRYAFRSLEEYAHWVVAKLRSGNLPTSELCRCKLEECQRFFLVIDSGTRPRRSYCSQEHMEAHHKKTSSERVARSRRQRMEKQRRSRRK